MVEVIRDGWRAVIRPYRADYYWQGLHGWVCSNNPPEPFKRLVLQVRAIAFPREEG